MLTPTLDALTDTLADAHIAATADALAVAFAQYLAR